jgi:hypothetical protein
VVTRPLQTCQRQGEPERGPGGPRRCGESTMGVGVVGGSPAGVVHDGVTRAAGEQR